MFKTYIGLSLGSCLVAAKPEQNEQNKHAAEMGHRVVFPDGYSAWFKEDQFRKHYRELTRHEIQITKLTDPELNVLAISSGGDELHAAFIERLKEVDDRG